MIHLITTLMIKNEKIVYSCCCGYFYNFKDAEKCIKENWGDIYEYGYYNYALIESVPEGICRIAKEKWFDVKPKESSYIIKEVEKPKFLKHIIGFSIG